MITIYYDISTAFRWIKQNSSTFFVDGKYPVIFVEISIDATWRLYSTIDDLVHREEP